MIKDPDAILDYAFDWSKWLAAGETIQSHTITTTGQIDLESHTHTDTVVTVWLGGGTVDTIVTVACLITTSQARHDERTMSIAIRER